MIDANRIRETDDRDGFFLFSFQFLSLLYLLFGTILIFRTRASGFSSPLIRYRYRGRGGKK